MRNLIAHALSRQGNQVKSQTVLSFSSRRKHVQEVNSKSSFKVLRDELKLIKSLETSVQGTVLCESLE